MPTNPNAMGTNPLGPLLIRMAIPATTAMAANGIYNIVDTIFIGRAVGPDAIGGLSIVFPVQMLLLALALATGQGASSIISRALGANKPQTARFALAHTLLLSFLAGTAVLLAGQLLAEPLLTILGAVDPIKDHARTYLRIILISAPFFCTSVAANNMARAEGRSHISMTNILIGSLSNIILDPIFIIYFKLGVSGAAWATVIAQLLASLYILFHYLTGRMNVIPKLQHFKLQPDILRQITVLGLPALARQGGLSIVVILINLMLGRYGGPLYISAYGIVYRINIFLFMPNIGIVQAYAPIAGYNYGAHLYSRVISILKLACVSSFLYGITVSLIIFFLRIPIISLFTTDQQLINTTQTVIYYILPLFPALGIQMIGSTFFQVIGKAVPSLILNLIRQFLFFPLFIIILSPLSGYTGTLLSIPLSDLLALILTLIFLARETRHIKEQQQTAPPS